jgi:hypothetical protein
MAAILLRHPQRRRRSLSRRNNGRDAKQHLLALSGTVINILTLALVGCCNTRRMPQRSGSLWTPRGNFSSERR